MAEFYSKRGETEKGLQYINRAHKLAQEVLDGLEMHKKYIKILDIKSQILQKDKKLAEALLCNQEAQKICDGVFPDGVGYWIKNELIQKQISIQVEVTGEEYKAEDLVKQQHKGDVLLLSKLPNQGNDTMFPRWQILSEMMAYVQLKMPHKVNKLLKELQKLLEEKGQGESQMKLFANFISLQVMQDPSDPQMIE